VLSTCDADSTRDSTAASAEGRTITYGLPLPPGDRPGLPSSTMSESEYDDVAGELVEKWGDLNAGDLIELLVFERLWSARHAS